MPVGTHGAVRGLHPAEVAPGGRRDHPGQHLPSPPPPGRGGHARAGRPAALHRLGRPMLTDSGGFQVFSLEGLRKITEEGVEFSSHIDGTCRTLTPESAMEIQWALGADIAMAFDHVVPGQAPPGAGGGGHGADAALAGPLSHTARRAPGGDAGRRSQTLWPIIQGGIHADLRRRSLEGTLERGPWTGIAIGGLSVGEPKPVMHRRPRGAAAGPARGDPPLSYGRRISGRSAGGDRAGRGPVRLRRRHPERAPRQRLDRRGRVNIRGAAHRTADGPAGPGLRLRDLPPFSRAYLRHLFVAEEMLGSGWCRFTTSGSWSGWRNRPGPRFWTAPSSAGAPRGSGSTTTEEKREHPDFDVSSRHPRPAPAVAWPSCCSRSAPSRWSSTS